MEKNYVELTGRLHRWEERTARNGTVYGRGWIEVPRSGDGTTKFPLLSFDAGGWEGWSVQWLLCRGISCGRVNTTMTAQNGLWSWYTST